MWSRSRAVDFVQWTNSFLPKQQLELRSNTGSALPNTQQKIVSLHFTLQKDYYTSVILHCCFALKHYEKRLFPFLEGKSLLRVFFLKDIKGKHTLIRLFLPSQPYVTSSEGSLENKLQTIQYTTSALVRWTCNQKKQIGISYYKAEVLHTAENAFIPVHYMQSKLEGKSRWSVISQMAGFSPLWYYL